MKFANSYWQAKNVVGLIETLAQLGNPTENLMIFQTIQEYLSSKEFLSALMGGCFTLFGVLIAYYIQTRKEYKSEKAEL